MPRPQYREPIRSDLYTSVYEQYYFQNSPIKKVKPIKKRKTVTKKKNNVIAKFFTFVCTMLLLFYVFPFAFKSYVVDVFPQDTKHMLNVNYKELLYPTHSYLYKDLFLGKYVVEDAIYKNPLMINIPETYERKGLKHSLNILASEYRRIKPSVYVYDYENNSFVDIDADVPYPAASIIKVPVLIEMFRQIEQGKFSLDDKMVLEDYYRASGSGKLQYSQGGIAHSMDYLARIMIENSDNSSTNMIISKMGGMSELNKAMNKWGLKTTQVHTWLPDMDGTNITTARELAKMFYNVDSTNLLSNNSKKHMADYLGHVKNNRLLQAGIPKEAILLHKTGDIGYMLGDAGIVKTANGKKYIVAILVKRPYNHHQGKEFIVKASKIIYNNISY